MSLDDRPANCPIKCLVLWDWCDEKRIVYLEKVYFIPTWLHIDMEIVSDLLCPQGTIDYSDIDLDQLMQTVILTRYEVRRGQWDHLEDFLKAGWVIQSEDTIVDQCDEI